MFYIDDEHIFPPVQFADKEGLLCFGGDLDPDRLILAYRSGIFPWSDDPVLWFSPNPRMIIDLHTWKPQKSLQRTLKKNKFVLKIDTCFQTVMEHCATVRDSTWISQDFIESYCELHRRGIAHSFEIFENENLVGGLYGLSMGSAFFGESMFHHVTDASKVAFSHLIFFLRQHNFTLLDCQAKNSHLVSLGAIAIKRTLYMKLLHNAIEDKTLTGSWQSFGSTYFENFPNQ